MFCRTANNSDTALTKVGIFETEIALNDFSEALEQLMLLNQCEINLYSKICWNKKIKINQKVLPKNIKKTTRNNLPIKIRKD